MKFHWGDFLDREDGHWQMTPNDQRGKYFTPDCAELSPDTRIVTVTRDTANLERLAELEELEELTLHETNQGQIDALKNFPRITRLRITHARPKAIAVLSELPNVEELVLEYVSGFDDIAPVASMPALRSLYMENLRKMKDFSALGKAKGLKYLSINGTFDWAQPIESLEFVSALKSLEFLGLSARIGDMESAAVLAGLGDGCKLELADNLLPIEHFADIEAKSQGATFQPVVYWYRTNPAMLPESDPRARLSPEDIEANHPEVFVRDDGIRMFFEPSEWDVYHLLGRGARDIPVTAKNAAEKAASYEEKYRKLVAATRP